MEIRDIHQREGSIVSDLWDRMCRETEGGGPLTDQGRQNLSRMLAMSAWHRDAFCLVAADGIELVGFVNGRVSDGDGLLPGLLGEIDSLFGGFGLEEIFGEGGQESCAVSAGSVGIYSAAVGEAF